MQKIVLEVWFQKLLQILPLATLSAGTILVAGTVFVIIKKYRLRKKIS